MTIIAARCLSRNDLRSLGHDLPAQVRRDRLACRSASRRQSPPPASQPTTEQAVRAAVRRSLSIHEPQPQL